MGKGNHVFVTLQIWGWWWQELKISFCDNQKDLSWSARSRCCVSGWQSRMRGAHRPLSWRGSLWWGEVKWDVPGVSQTRELEGSDSAERNLIVSLYKWWALIDSFPRVFFLNLNFITYGSGGICCVPNIVLNYTALGQMKVALCTWTPFGLWPCEPACVFWFCWCVVFFFFFKKDLSSGLARNELHLINTCWYPVCGFII